VGVGGLEVVTEIRRGCRGLEEVTEIGREGCKGLGGGYSLVLERVSVMLCEWSTPGNRSQTGLGSCR